MEATVSPWAGLYKPLPLKALYYGPDCVSKNLLSCLPSENSKAFIITGSSLYNKTPLIKQLEQLLTPKHHAGTFSNIKEHAPIAELDAATKQVHADPSIDTIIAVGGGSPIDSAKAISYRLHEKGGNFLNHVVIPTTLSAAECTAIAGYTKEDGEKTGIGHPGVYASYILYDSKFALHTPPKLFASTGIRALDHAVEMHYHPTATFMPCHFMSGQAIAELFNLLPKYMQYPESEDVIIRLFLAAFASLGFLGANTKGGLGLSHTLGYALGSPYMIPHGITSCMTLGHVVKLKANLSYNTAKQISNILPQLGMQRTGDDVMDAQKVGDAILGLVDELGFKTTLTEKGVGRDQLDVICARAAGGLTPESVKEKSDLEQRTYNGIRKLVEGLY
jgi:alcohol dehydrogenase class IV